MNSVFRFSFSLLILVLCCSCGSSFRKAWREAPDPSGINGRWSGSWESLTNGHRGVLRCVVKDGPSPDTKTFVYRAGWMKVLATTVSTEKRVTKTTKGWRFEGGKDLGGFGSFTAQGMVEGDQFSATYDSSLDRGTFRMQRAVR
jgi:hypothetical protein